MQRELTLDEQIELAEWEVDVAMERLETLIDQRNAIAYANTDQAIDQIAEILEE